MHLIVHRVYRQLQYCKYSYRAWDHNNIQYNCLGFVLKGEPLSLAIVHIHFCLRWSFKTIAASSNAKLTCLSSKYEDSDVTYECCKVFVFNT